MTKQRAIEDLTEKQAKAEWARLAEEIRSADQAYYQDDAPELTDADYDALRQRLQAIEDRLAGIEERGMLSESKS